MINGVGRYIENSGTSFAVSLHKNLCNEVPAMTNSPVSYLCNSFGGGGGVVRVTHNSGRYAHISTKRG